MPIYFSHAIVFPNEILFEDIHWVQKYTELFKPYGTWTTIIFFFSIFWINIVASNHKSNNLKNFQDAEGLQETGRFYGVSPVYVEGVAHDMMLDCYWEEGAKVILSWLNGLSR